MKAIAWSHIPLRVILALVVFVLSSSIVAASQPLQRDEKKMQPVLPDNKQFMMGTASSNSVTPLVLEMLDRKFFEETGAPRDQRNTGTIKLNLLVREVLYDTPNANKILETEDKEALANEILKNYLEAYFPSFVKAFAESGSLNVDQVTAVSDKIKGEILFRAKNPTDKVGPGGKLRVAEIKASGEMAQMRRKTSHKIARAPSSGLVKRKSSGEIDKTKK